VNSCAESTAASYDLIFSMWEFMHDFVKNSPSMFIDTPIENLTVLDGTFEWKIRRESSLSYWVYLRTPSLSYAFVRLT
jgi:hypothetical protein